ncbi:MAG: anaerobic glycerol-3-phosphate dehydrogenase subunit C [Planctomycetota bacterium]|nr:MAG: anaerobic glycerol-3-phosphate dehydrogenase subunit C [Planctomycetota bacterium]
MDPERQRIQDDLRGLVKGDVRCDDVFVHLYATDASIYEIPPLAVVRPRNLTDVVAVVEYAAENDLAIHPRGAGTGLAGESLGRGIMLDFSRYMRRVLETDDRTVRVQPGIPHAQLNEHLRARGRQFGPDPAMSDVTTMGSVVAVDSGGSRWLKYGSARRNVISLEIVLADGDVLHVGREPLMGHRDPESPKAHLVTTLADLLRRNADIIAEHQPQSAVNRSGYHLDILSQDTLDLAGLLSGSEGTLAVITEATLATHPLPKHRGVALLLFDRLESAARAVMEILPFEPSACDLMDRRHLSLARESTVQFDLLIPSETEAALLVEQEGDTLVEVSDKLAQVVERVRRKKRLAFHAIQAQDREEVELYWGLARKVVPTLHRMKGSTRPLPFIEDMAVPPRALPDFLVQMQNVLKQHQVTASLFGHAGHGQLHLRPLLDLSKPDDVARMSRLAADLYGEVIDAGGTISGEHADGLSRTGFIRRQYGPLADVFRRVKRVFDPQNILNPGKIVGSSPDLLTNDLRRLTVPPPPPKTESDDEPQQADPAAPQTWQLSWSSDEIALAARNCNGCGACRSQMDDVRMCPIFRFAPAEESSPRAKANLMRSILTGGLPLTTLTTDEYKDVTDLCVNCHMCRLECPATVDIPKLMMEGKGSYVQINGLSSSDWLMSRIDRLSSFAGRFPRLANLAITNGVARWLMEKTLGIAQGRKLPRLARRNFLKVAAKRRLTRPTRRDVSKVLYFVDTYANHHDPQLAEAFVSVLEHNAVAVYVHPAQQSSGMPMISLGALAAARELATHNVALLAEAVRQGYHVVATEPSAALALTHEYPKLLDDDDARLVAANTSEACAYLWRLHQAGKLQLDLHPINGVLGYHMPCHVRAMQTGAPGENLLRLIPGLVVERTENSCSGMAGTFGLKRENYRASLRAGRALIGSLRSPRLQAGTTECSACKIQMEQGAGKPTIHPVKLLALAYGLMPEVAELLSVQVEELVVT